MKKFILIIALLFAFDCTAAQAPQMSFPQTAQNILRKLFGENIDRAPEAMRFTLMEQTGGAADEKSRSVWDGIASFFANGSKEAKKKAVAAYLYNMYITNAIYKKISAPEVFDFNFIGAADPFYYISWNPNKGDITKFYKNNKEDIKQYLWNIFAGKTAIAYNISSPENDRMEENFIKIFEYTATPARQYGYLPAAAEANEELSQKLARELESKLSQNNLQNESLAAVYKITDPLDALGALDNKFAPNRNSRTVKTYWRPLKEECALCAYTFCKNICENIKAEYDGFSAARVYKISALNKNGGILRPRTRKNFISHDGKTYPDWDYHTASLLILKKDDEIVKVVVDTFLLGRADTLGTWAQLFGEGTVFIISPFKTNTNVEESIIRKSDLPRDAMPYPVRPAPAVGKNNNGI